MNDIHGPKRAYNRVDWRGKLQEAGVTPPVMEHRLNSHIDEQIPRSRPFVLRKALRYIRWYENDDTMAVRARIEGIGQPEVSVLIRQMSLVALNPLYDEYDHPRDWITPGMIEYRILLGEIYVEGELEGERSILPIPTAHDRPVVVRRDETFHPIEIIKHAEPDEATEIAQDAFVTTEPVEIAEEINIPKSPKNPENHSSRSARELAADLVKELKLTDRYEYIIRSLIDTDNEAGARRWLAEEEVPAVMALRRRIYERAGSIDSLNVQFMTKVILLRLLGGEVNSTDAKPGEGEGPKEVSLQKDPMPARQQVETSINNSRSDRWKSLRFIEAMNEFAGAMAPSKSKARDKATTEEPATTAIIEE